MKPSITGFNHIVMVCKDMNRTVDFYGNILGLKVVATGEQSLRGALTSPAKHRIRRLYFLEMDDGSQITFVELPDNDTQADASVFHPNYWPVVGPAPERPRKMDHVAFNVKTRSDVLWFQKRLREHEIVVTEIQDRNDEPKGVSSIYFCDPDGVPLEIATWDRDDPDWQNHKSDNYFQDPDPVPALEGARR